MKPTCIRVQLNMLTIHIVQHELEPIDIWNKARHIGRRAASSLKGYGTVCQRDFLSGEIGIQRCAELLEQLQEVGSIICDIEGVAASTLPTRVFPIEINTIRIVGFNLINIPVDESLAGSRRGGDGAIRDTTAPSTDADQNLRASSVGSAHELGKLGLYL